ncbi:hypothetical protein [Bradyrhizobium sp. CB3481]|nr:hypothetical protein [Bradyrhizobium sp. CB3481]WFU19230.1 hypothetical protein QA643_13185 [Bradyrhizobium sp. CB3481]
MTRLLDLTNFNASPEGLMPQGHTASAACLRLILSMTQAWPPQRGVC